MNTTIIKANAETRKQIMDVVYRKLSTAIRPVVTFLNDDDTMVISGCSTTQFCSALTERLGKKIEIVKAC